MIIDPTRRICLYDWHSRHLRLGRRCRLQPIGSDFTRGGTDISPNAGIRIKKHYQGTRPSYAQAAKDHRGRVYKNHEYFQATNCKVVVVWRMLSRAVMRLASSKEVRSISGSSCRLSG